MKLDLNHIYFVNRNNRCSSETHTKSSNASYWENAEFIISLPGFNYLLGFKG